MAILFHSWHCRYQPLQPSTVWLLAVVPASRYSVICALLQRRQTYSSTLRRLACIQEWDVSGHVFYRSVHCDGCRLYCAHVQFSSAYWLTVALFASVVLLAATHLLPHLIGADQAARLFYTAETVNGEQAHKLGMVTELVDESTQVLPAALQLATAIASNSTDAVRTTATTMRLRHHTELERALT